MTASDEDAVSSASDANYAIEEDGETTTAKKIGLLDIELLLTENGETTKKTDFSSSPLIISTYVGTGRNGNKSYTSDSSKYSVNTVDGTGNSTSCTLKVPYNKTSDDNTEGDGTVLAYDATTGMLTFSVTHLSEYYIVETGYGAYVKSTKRGYDTLKEAVAAASSGDTIEIWKNTELDSTVEITKSLTLNLGGKTISAKQRAFFVKNGTLTIENGTIETTHNTENETYWTNSAIRVSNNASYTGTKEALGLTLAADAKIIANNSYGITAFGADDAVLNIYGTIESKNACIGGNGSYKDSNEDEIKYPGKITVNVYEGAALTATGNPTETSSLSDTSSHTVNGYLESCAIYQPNFYGVLNISGGTITSKYMSAVEIRRGNANITGGTFVSEAGTYNEKAVTNSNSNGGPEVAGAAIAINYYGEGNLASKAGVTVTIEGGTFTAKKHLVILAPENYDKTEATVKAVVGEGVNMSSYRIVGARRSDSVGIDGNYYVSLDAAEVAGETGKIHVNSIQDIPTSDSSTYSWDVNSTGKRSVNGENKYIVDLFQDLYYGDDVTIENVIFAQGISLRNNSNVKAPGENENTTKVTVKDCEVYGCDWQDWIDYVGKNADGSKKSGWNNAGEAACLLFDGDDTTTGAVDFVIENCKFDGRSVVTDPKKTEGKSRGNGVGFGQTNGTQTNFLKSAVIKNCSFTNLRNHAVQTYGLKGSLTVEKCSFNSWGVNTYEEPCKTGQEKEGEADYAYAVKGDAADGATEASVAIINCTFNYTSNSEKNTNFKFKGENMTATWTDENNMTAENSTGN